MKRNADLDRLTDRLRDRIFAGLHLGSFEPGCSLPGTRELACEMGADHRAVSKAYRALESEGLVDVRGRSGAYLRKPAWMEDRINARDATWVTQFMVEAWRRRIPIPDLSELVRAYTHAGRLRCVCIESTEDCLVALTEELREEFGLDTRGVLFNGLPEANAERPAALARLRREIGNSDFVVTLTFHAGAVREIAQAVGKPLVVIGVHPELSGAIDHRLAHGPLTFVVADPMFGDRIRKLHGAKPEMSNHIRIVLADDAEAVARLSRAEPVFLTRAARAKLGKTDLPSLLPHSPSISPECALGLSRLIVRLRTSDAGAH